MIPSHLSWQNEKSFKELGEGNQNRCLAAKGYIVRNCMLHGGLFTAHN